LASFKQTLETVISVFFMRTQLASCALNTHFSRCANAIQTGNQKLLKLQEVCCCYWKLLPPQKACARKCFAYLTKWSSVIYPDGWTVCYVCWMYPFFNESVGEVLVTSACRTLLQYIAKIRKGIWKSFAALVVDLPRFRTVLTSRSSASRLLSVAFFLVRII